jgi:tripeptidyl-peptidase-2
MNRLVSPHARPLGRATPASAGLRLVLHAAALLVAGAGAPGVAAGDPSPADGLLPKVEIGARRFLEKHPTYDGRGVIIAVLDSGVDPGAAGLQTTPDGRPKILDLVDGSGSGDVDTSTVVEAVEGRLAGLSGRSLRVGPGWKNPTGKYHLGLKAGYDVYPQGLIERMQERRRERREESRRPREARLRQSLVDWKAAHPVPGDEALRERKDLEARLAQLMEVGGTFEDPGPLFDCVVFHDGGVWRAVVDTDEDGDLGEEAVLTNYRTERRHGTFGGEELLNFAVNIYREGKLLSIVTDAGSHGTHVAGIAAGHVPGQPDLDGIAPGAQIVSVKNGPNRLHGGRMETGAAIARSLAVIRETKCDILSASFGETVGRPDQGRVIELLSELVWEDGVIFVAAAANDGPALSTVAAPGGTSSAAIGVGAYLSPAMLERQYGRFDVVPETLFDFSSRGPAADGALGVSVCAPGGAVSSVPNWSLSRHAQMSGTSMATPAVSGAVALVLSGLKAEGLGYSPASLRRALENSARPIPGVERFEQGQGLVQVDAAFDLARRLAAAGTGEPRLEVTVSPFGSPGRGVYLREPEQTREVLRTSARVRAVFPKAADNRRKLAYEARFRLEATAPWVRVARSLLLDHGPGEYAGSSFDFAVDPTGLDAGVQAAEILGFEEGREDLGPAFRVPVTVIRPVRFEPGSPPVWNEAIPVVAAGLERRFLAVPAGASWAELRIRPSGFTTERSVAIHGTQLLPGRRPRRALGTWLEARDGREETVRFRVTGGRTLELTVADQSTASDGDRHLELTLDFRGVIPGSPESFFDGGTRVLRIEATAVDVRARVEPVATLQARRRSVPPTAGEVRPLDPERDRLPEGRRMHEVILSYPFTLDEPGSVIPRFPALQARFYDGEFAAPTWMIHDDARRLVVVEDCMGEPGAIPLGKGAYTLRLQLRHERPDWLEKAATLPLVLDQPLAGDIALPVFADPDGPFSGRVAGPGRAVFGSGSPAPGESSIHYLGTPDAAQLARAGKPGDLLVGILRYEAEPCPVAYPLAFLIPPAPAAVAEPVAASPDDRKPEERLADERLDFEIAQLAKLPGATNDPVFSARFEGLRARHADHLPLLAARLHHLDDDERVFRLRSIVAAADEVIRRVDTQRLASRFGVRSGGETAAERGANAEAERERDALVDALHRKTRALALMLRPPPGLPAAPGEVEAPFEAAEAGRLLDESYAELRRWVDPAREEWVSVRILWEWHHGRLGEAAALLRGEMGRRPTDRALREEWIRLLRDLGWDEEADAEVRGLPLRFPREFTPF